jgi:hypothetical protein
MNLREALLLCAGVLFVGLMSIAYGLYAIAKSMDRLAKAQEQAPAPKWP